MPITLRQLGYFEMTVRCGSLTEAAKQLNISQSALSLAIKELEIFFESRLLERLNTGVKLTNFGHLVFIEARKINQNVGHLQSLKKQLQNPIEGHVCVSLSAIAIIIFIPNLIAKFRATYPNIRLELLNAESPGNQVLLQSNKVDFCVSAIPKENESGLESHPLRIYPRRLWVHGDHELSKQEAVKTESLADERLFLYEHDLQLPDFSEYLQDLAIPSKQIELINSTEAMRNLIEANEGVTILSEFSFYASHMAEKNVYCKRLLPTPPPAIIGTTINHKTPLSEAASILHDFFVDYAASI